jgi:hypothetical protein
MALSKSNPDMTTTNEEKKETLNKLTKHIEKLNYDPKKFNCPSNLNPTFNHDIDWEWNGGFAEGTCKNCKERFTI